MASTQIVPAFERIAILGPLTETLVTETMTALATYLLKRGLTVLAEPAALALAKGMVAASDEQIRSSAQLVITVGGDGTLLRAARLLAGTGIPLLGINRGRLGFLADISPVDMTTPLDAVLAGEFESGSRSMLQVTLQPAQGTALHSVAINDCVLQKWETGHMLNYETWVDGQYVNTHGGDGVIVATATGSTAYALSCGGPIIHPALDAMVIAPICPHTLSDRPIVIAANSTVEIRRVQDRVTKAQVTCDGNMLGDLNHHDRLIIGPAAARVNLIHPRGHNYYRTLRSKLHWGRDSRTVPDRDENQGTYE